MTLSSTVNKIKRANQQIYYCLEDNNYQGINNWNIKILDYLDYLNIDVDIFIDKENQK